MAGKTKKSSKRTSKTQHDKFVQAAQELEVDEDERAFERKLKKIAKQQPKTRSDQ